MEATAGIEPADKGFADLCLTTWLRRPGAGGTASVVNRQKSVNIRGCQSAKIEIGRLKAGVRGCRDLN